MAKIILIFVATIVVCATLCYTTSRVCDTIDSKFTSVNSNIDTKTEGLSKEHEVLMKDHEALMGVANETRITARENNKMLTYLYNMARNQNPDVKFVDEKEDK